MWLFVLVVLVQAPRRTTGECRPLVLLSHTVPISVVLGGPFNLTCDFSCVSGAHRVQLLKNKVVWVEGGVSGACASSGHNLSLSLRVPAAQLGDAGQYKCQSSPRDAISTTVNVDVMEVVTSKTKPACEPPQSSSSWALANAPVWYLMGKAAVFVVCLLSAVLRRTP